MMHDDSNHHGFGGHDTGPPDDTGTPDDTAPPDDAVKRSGSTRKTIKRVLAAVIFCLVVAGIARTVRNASIQFKKQQRVLAQEIQTQERLVANLAKRPSDNKDLNGRQRESRRLRELKRQQFRWTSIDWRLLFVGCALYSTGMLPSWFFFHETLERLGQHPSRKTTFRAFFIGHLGKYVPGKALVVVLRSTLVAGPNVSLGAGIVAVFVETLTMMAVGATLGGFLLLIVSGNQWLVAGAACLACLAGIPTIPPLFRTVVARLQRKRNIENTSIDLNGIDWSLMRRGWLFLLIEWSFFGASLAATLLAIPGVSSDVVLQPQTLCLVTATVSLAIVLGFVSLVPGGAGIREWVVTTALGSVVGIGPIRALVAAILLRFVWLIPELIFAGAGYFALNAERSTSDVERSK